VVGGGTIFTAEPGHGLTEAQSRLARALLAAGPLTHEGLERQLERSGKGGSVLGKALLQAGYAREEDLLGAVVRRHRMPRINVKTAKIPLETLALVPSDVAKRLRFLPLDEIGDVIVVVTPDVFNIDAIDELRRALAGRRVSLIQCAEEGFDRILEGHYQRLAEAQPPKLPPAPAPPPVPAPAGTPAGAVGAAAGVALAVPAGRRGPNGPLRALPATAEDLASARPLAGRHLDRRAEWDWTYASEGPVRAVEAPL
jgi:hypothetical protein